MALPNRSEKKLRLSFRPLTSALWPDLEKLFGARGACGGCWCMWWRLKRSRFLEQKGDRNKAALKRVVDSKRASGLLAYSNGQAIGWCAVAPREDYPALERSRILRPIDDRAVWSITCLFVAKSFRRHGVSVELLKAAVDYVRRMGGAIVEGYPVEAKKDGMPDPFVWTGLASAFRRAGYKECARRSPTRPIMRFEIG